MGRKHSSKPADAFGLGLSDEEMLYPRNTTGAYWPDLNFAFEGNFSVSFGPWGGEPLSYIVRMAQAGSGGIIGVNPWNFGGSGCSQSQCNTQFPAFRGCLKCGKLCFKTDGSKTRSSNQVYVWPC